MRSISLAGCVVVALLACPNAARAQEWGTISGMHNYEGVFGVPRDAGDAAFKVTPTESSAPGNVFHEGEQPRFVYQIENLTDEPLRADGRIEIIRYSAGYHEGDQWWPELAKLGDVGSVPVSVDLAPGGWANLEVEPPTPETKGGYGLIVDLGDAGRAYLTSYVRTFRPELKREQFPTQALEDMPAPILARLGVQAIRYGVSYVHSQHPTYAEFMEWFDGELRSMHENMVTCIIEIGAGRHDQPLGRPRPHLDENAVMLDTKSDMVWLPEDDDDYQSFVYRLAAEYGWPNGPVTGFMLWNEPWEGLSISGWGADMIRYRELYRRMGEAVARARKEAGVDVLVGGCDSSTNTWDKLFPDGSEDFLPYLDFCSIHYQGLSAPVLYPLWNEREHNHGRVLIWDTESWVANSDDRLASVVATNRAAGYDRSMGHLSRISISTLSHNRIAYDTIRSVEGDQRVERLIEARPPAASIGAVQHFLGQRPFREILYDNGLPWVCVFDGLGEEEDDGTVVVVGDIDSLFNGGALYSTVRSLDEVDGKREARERYRSLPPDSPERARLAAELLAPMPLSGAWLSLPPSDAYALYDFYGNPVPPEGDLVRVPLDTRGFFLRPSGPTGSFGELLDALKTARIDGLEPLEIIAHDFTERIEDGPELRLDVTNMLNRRVEGRLEIRLGDLEVDAPRVLRLQPRESRTLELAASGNARPDNTYPLAVTFDADDDGLAVHDEDLHVNLISRKTIEVDGELADWEGALPQTIRTDAASEGSFAERMWLPFEDFGEGVTGGLATGYLAYDDDYFYFAAKIADDSKSPGALRFAARDHDADFYPEVCYEMRDGARRELTWPEGVRRFSYRRWPALPSSYGSVPLDNVLIAFNAIPMDDDDWLAHLPGRPPGFIGYKCTDYEYALNTVAEEFGGGTEVWRLQVPGMPRKHFYPRQPAHPLEGAVEAARLATVHEGNTRVTEVAVPWSEIPHVRECLDRSLPVKFSFRVNNDTGGPTMELAMDRSVSKRNSQAFHPDWAEHWANELEFGWER